MEAQQLKKTDVLTSIRLGWLVVESFGRLGMYDRSPQKPVKRTGYKSKPFAYSINESRSLDELMWSVNALHSLYEALDFLDCPPIPLPAGDALLKHLEDADLDLDLLQDELDVWSKNVWGLLNVRSGLAARAFFYGGSLANTYWYTTIVWGNKKKIAEFLNRYRLDYLATQFELISDSLPAYVAECFACSLRKWASVDLEAKALPSLKSRLEAQQKVWRELLFEIRAPETYLRRRHYGTIRLYSLAAQFLVAVVLFILIYFGGREVGSLFPSDASGDLSSFFAAVSGFVLVVGGVITQLANWIKTTGDWVSGWMKRRMILKYTLRDWK